MSVTYFSFSDNENNVFLKTTHTQKKQLQFQRLNPYLSDLNRQVRCLAAAEVDGVCALMVPEADPGAWPEGTAQAPWNEMEKNMRPATCIKIN